MKKDAEAWEETPSDLSSAVNQHSDIVSGSQDDELPSTSGKAKQRHPERRGTASYQNEIAALSDKYSGDYRTRKSFPQDKLSSLEQKYLRKHVPRTVDESSEDLERYGESSSLSSVLSESKRVKKSSSTVTKKVAAATPKQRHRGGSDTSSVDEELANYLNQTSLSEKQPDSCISDSKVQSYEDEDSLDEMLNINNLMTVDDILGQVTNDDEDSSKPPSEAEKPLRVTSGQNKQVVQAGNSAKSKESSSGQNKNVYSDQDIVSNDDDDNEYNKPIGILLAQTSNNVFRSSRRKSSIEFNVDNFLKLQTHQRERSDPEILSEEHITSSLESNVEESVVKTELSEEDQTVEEECTGDKTSDERKEENLSSHSQAASHIQSTSHPQYTSHPQSSSHSQSSSKNKSKEVESMQANKFFTQRESNAQTSASCVASGNSVPSTSYTEEETDAGKETHKSNATRTKPKNRGKEKSPVRGRKKSLHSDKSKHRKEYTSSTPTSDSTSTSSSDSEVDRRRHSHRHKHRHKHRHRRRRSSSYDRLVRFQSSVQL